jgi:hypothetical protein
MIETPIFAVGDKVRTLRGSVRGIIKRIQPDGRVVWLPNGRKMELIAQPEDPLLA